MAKFIYVNSKSRVQYVEDSRPTIAGGEAWIEVSNDSVAENWYYDADTQTVSQYQPYNIAQVRGMRNAKLSESDWMVMEDSPYQASDQSSNLTAIKTYRQQLRDFPDESATYNENNINWPTLTLT
jgi:AAA15 family ATPase/GTPase|tara:strand:+ start:231 stop:605 length:375 start_codon:yes stop_codon:yes gene_type:complete